MMECTFNFSKAYFRLLGKSLILIPKKRVVKRSIKNRIKCNVPDFPCLKAFFRANVRIDMLNCAPYVCFLYLKSRLKKVILSPFHFSLLQSISGSRRKCKNY